MTRTRSARLRVEYDNHDITAQIAPYVISATFIDHAHGKADSLSIVLEDRAGLWKGGWRPSKGATVKAWFDCLDWAGPGRNISMFCGSFEVDKVGCSISESGDTFTIKGVSAKVRNSLRGEKKSRGWENSTVEAVVRDVAKEAGMGLVMETRDIFVDRLDQAMETDLGFLKRVIDSHGLNLKVAEDSLIVFEGKTYDSRSPVVTLTRGSSAISSVRMDDGVTEVYRACTVSYHDPATKENLEYTYVPDDAPASGQVLKVNKRVKSLAEAIQLAQDRLREKNKDECTGSFSVMGDPRLRGAAVVALKGLSGFDGNYFVESVTHSIDDAGGYSTEGEIRRTLEY